MTENLVHKPVLLQEFLEYAGSEKYTTLWDGTLGAAGHCIEWLDKEPDRIAYGSDADREMLIIAETNLNKHFGKSKRYFLEHGNYSINPHKRSGPFDVILLDLGISSYHLDRLDRGISYRFDQELDMRLDTHSGKPLYLWLNHATLDEIKKVIYLYGEEKMAPQIARNIVQFRKKEPIHTTAQLKVICENSYPKKMLIGDSRHPSVKTFQAFRIFINKELEHLEKALVFLPDMLSPGGRLVIITFHSLEDRIVKHSFLDHSRILQSDPRAKSNYLPGPFKVITQKPIIPSQSELDNNSRSRSAKMRILEKIK